MAWWDQYFGGEQRGKVPVERLSFDDHNPRYTPEKRPANSSDAATIEYLSRTADLGELIQSIAASGYIDIEPIIVLPRGDKLIVLEGNRRLAALKALRSPALADKANVSIPDMRPEVVASLDRVTAFKVDREEDARNLIGFKHINGPQGWDAYAKALYAKRWLDSQSEAGSEGLKLTDIAARMGDKHDTLYRIVSAAYVLEQAENSDLFAVEDRVARHFSFSHLYTALTYTEFREFIGLPRADRSADPERDPVPDDKKKSLQMLLRWLYGSKSNEIKPVITTQAKDLSKLKTVIGNTLARRALMERNDLPEALAMTVAGNDRFERAIFDAQASLKIASSDVLDALIDATLIEVSIDVERRAYFIAEYLRSQSDTSRRG